MKKTFNDDGKSSESEDSINPPPSKSARVNTPDVDKEFGKWDVGGKAMKMMLKMGYKKVIWNSWWQGQGLGANSSGIVKPVETQVRPKKIGIAYKGFRERKHDQQINESDKSKEIKPEYVPSWRKKTPKPKSNNEKVMYKTAMEMQMENIGEEKQQMKIIDMTQETVIPSLTKDTRDKCQWYTNYHKRISSGTRITI